MVFLSNYLSYSKLYFKNHFKYIAGAQLGVGKEKRPPLPFFENQKKCPDFRKKGPDYVHPYVKFIIQNQGRLKLRG